MKIDLPRNFDAQTAKFSEILAKFNRVHSLTNYKNLNEQIADSIAPLEIFPQISGAETAIDVGSGAGFPAIFLAMILRECEWYLFEPSPKKSAFLSYVKAELNLNNVRVKSCKIQDGEPFAAQLITSRALMKTKDLLRICNGFFDAQTQILLYKGSSVQSELEGLNAQIYGRSNRNYVLIKGGDVI